MTAPDTPLFDSAAPPIVKHIRSGFCHARGGWGRSDLIVTVVVVLILALLLLPFLNQQRGMSRLQVCTSRQQKVAAALLAAESLQGHFPGYRLPVDAAGESRPVSWASRALPFVGKGEPGQNQPAAAPDLHIPADAGQPLQASSYLADLVCPADKLAGAEPGALTWVVNSGLPDAPAAAPLPPDWPANGVFHDHFLQAEGSPQRKVLTTVRYLNDHDGAETTLLLAENVDSGDWTDDREPRVAFVWVAQFDDQGGATRGEELLAINARRGEAPANPSYRFARPASFHTGGANAAYADGRVKFMNENIDYLVFSRLMTPDGENVAFAGRAELIPEPYRRLPDPPAASAK